MKEDKEIDRIIGQKLAAFKATPPNLKFKQVHKNFIRRNKLALLWGRSRSLLSILLLAALSAGFYFLTKPVDFLQTKQTKTSTAKVKTTTPNQTNSKIASKHHAENELKNNIATNSGLKEGQGSEMPEDAPVPFDYAKASSSEKGNSHETRTFTTQDDETKSKTNGKPETDAPPVFLTTKRNDKIQPKHNTDAKSSVLRNTDGTPALKNAEQPIILQAATTTSNNKQTDGKLQTPVAQKSKPNVVNNLLLGNTRAFGPLVSNVIQKNKGAPETAGDNDIGKEAKANKDNVYDTGGAKTKSDAIKTLVAASENPKGNTQEHEADLTIISQSDSTSKKPEENGASVEPASEPAPETKSTNAALALPTAQPSGKTPRKSHITLSAGLMRNVSTPNLEANTNAGGSVEGNNLLSSSRFDAAGYFSGMLSLGYSYKKFGVSAGVSYLDAKGEANTESFTQKQDYYRIDTIRGTTTTTSAITYTTYGPPVDSLNPPPVITYTLMDVDTIPTFDTNYVWVGSRTYAVVNGDTVNPQAYKTRVRFLTIPLHISYSISMAKNKLILEPELGV